MPNSETLQRLAEAKAIFNAQYNYLYDAFPEIAWRLRLIDQTITAFEDEIETLLALNAQLSNERRKPLPNMAEVVAEVLEKMELQSYDEL